MKLQISNSKLQIINAVILSLLLMTSCLKFHKQRTIIEPINVAIVDESRVDNIKIRHIFKEMLLKEIVTQNIDWLMVYTSDTGNIDYIIAFDIMDYETYDIEQGIIKILASIKILIPDNKIILSSDVADARDKDIKNLCKKVSNKLCSTIIKNLDTIYRKRLKERIFQPADSL
jgi:hypothetical protein